MTPHERAQHYAGLFTANGDRWRMWVPADGNADRKSDRMDLGGVCIEKPEGAPYWRATS